MTILTVRNVNKRFGGLKALDEVNLEIEEGTVHAIIGPNGAGKSTLLNCFIGRLDPDTGSVDFDGVSLLGMKLDTQREAQYLGAVAQGLRLDGDTCNAIHDKLQAPRIFK